MKIAMTVRKLLLVAVIAATLAACGKSAPGPSEQATSAADASQPDAIAAAVANTQRLAGDAEEDGWRKPTAMLQFLEVRPGASVIDYFSGGGYFTELLSYAVGPAGKVIAFNNEPYLKFAADKPAQRYGNGRLPNVTQVTMLPESVELAAQSLDGALFVMSYHDLYWRPKDGSWPATDAAAALQKLVPALKPGAAVVVIDHAADAGADPLQSVDAMHRIDPEVVKRDFTAAGLEFETESALLRNPQDDHTRQVFDPAVQHQTDRFVYRFRKK